MRYREGETPDNIGSPVSGDMLIFGAIIGLLIGVVLSIAGIRGRQIWLAFWGGVLVVKSVAYLAASALGFA